MDGATPAESSFGTLPFGRANLGDPRLNRRLAQLADEATGHPGGTLPDKLRQPKDLKAFYRLMNNRRTSHETILAPHRQQTLERLHAHPGVVLVLHDTTELDYSSLHSLADVLGSIGEGHGQGYLCHHPLAVAAATQEVLGLANQILFHRPETPPQETKAQSRQRETRESRLWVKGSQGVPSAPAEALWVEISDRAGATTEFLDYLEDQHKHYVLRSQHHRLIQVEGGGEECSEKPHDGLRTLPKNAQRKIELTERPKRPARSATVAVAWGRVPIVPPRQARGEGRGVPLSVWALRVWEIDAPPAGAEALEWFLLTNVPAPTRADAWERVGWYCQRWIIEEDHKGMKTGCEVESLQFTSEQALQPAIAFLSVVTLWLLWLLWLRTQSRRPEAETTPATAMFPQDYVEMLALDRYREVHALTVREFCLALARMGGHQNRKHDRPPGWLVLRRGWTKLHIVVQGARAFARKRCGHT